MSMVKRGIVGLVCILALTSVHDVCASEQATGSETSPMTEEYWRVRLSPWPHRFEWLGETPVHVDKLVLTVPAERSEVVDGAVADICVTVSSLCGRPPIVASSAPEDATFILRLNTGRIPGIAGSPEARKPQGYHMMPFEVEGKPGLAIWSHDPAGALYASQTLRQLLRKDEEGRLLMPRVRITDAPDLEDRGYWLAARREPAMWDLAGWKKHIDWAASRRFNVILVLIAERDSPLFYNSKAFPKHVSPDHPLAEAGVFRAVVDYGRRRAVRIVPTIPHLDFLVHLWRSKPEALVSLKGRRTFRGVSNEDREVVDFSRPEALEVLTELIADMALVTGADELSVWPVEAPWATNEEALLAEVKALCKAHQAAAEQVSRPLTLRLLTNPLTFAISGEMSRVLPPTVKIDVYGSQRGTYHLGGMKLDEATMQIMRDSGFHFSMVPAYGRLFWSGLPLALPALARDNAIESAGQGAQGLVANGGDQPTTFALNYAAGAEFAWNTHGRTLQEFIEAWARAQGYAQPENVPDLYEHLENASVAVGLAHGQRFLPRRMSISFCIEEPAQGDPEKRRVEFIEPLEKALVAAEAAAEAALAIGADRLITETAVMRALTKGVLNLHLAIAARESGTGNDAYRAHLETALAEFSRIEAAWPGLCQLNPGTEPEDPVWPYRREIRELLAQEE